MYSRPLLFAASCVGMFLFGIVLISLGTILPALIAEYQMNKIAAGTLVSLLPFGILAGSLVFGPVADRYGYKSLLVINTLLILLGLEGIAYSGSFFVLQLSIFLIGLGGGVINGGVSALVADISTKGKGANLSLLGVFFGLGALGMPVLLGILSQAFTYKDIIAAVGFCVLLPALLFAVIPYPAPKNAQGLVIREGLNLLKEPTILLIGFFLFFQSGMEGLINNWTTTYLQTGLQVSPQDSLFALSYFIVAMTITRLLLGGLLKRVSSFPVLWISVLIALAGGFLMATSSSYSVAIAGLVLLGIGVAGGFPILLGYVGEIYAHLSGTAFSIVLVIGLVGNMTINYSMGVVAEVYGIEQLSKLILSGLSVMLILLFFIRRRLAGRVEF